VDKILNQDQMDAPFRAAQGGSAEAKPGSVTFPLKPSSRLPMGTMDGRDAGIPRHFDAYRPGEPGFATTDWIRRHRGAPD
jgi:hypothetical protein